MANKVQTFKISATGTSETDKTAKGSICTLSGWPVWGMWIQNTFPTNTVKGSLQGLYNQPFLMISNQSPIPNKGTKDLGLYSHFDLDKYAPNNLVTPFPTAVANNLDDMNLGGLGKIHKNIAKYNTGINAANQYNRNNRTCSYGNDGDNQQLSWAPAYYNSWCQYTHGQVSNANPQQVGDTVLELTEPVDGSNTGAFISGLYDVFGNYYPAEQCNTSTCSQVT